MLQALMCKLNIRHEWHVEHTEDGSLYKRCIRCGRDDDRGGGGTGAPRSLGRAGRDGLIASPRNHRRVLRVVSANGWREPAAFHLRCDQGIRPNP
jgi:hypothetical protein